MDETAHDAALQRRRNRRRRTGGLALRVAAVMTTASLVTGCDGTGGPQPGGPSPTGAGTATDAATAVGAASDPVRLNGRVTDAEHSFGEEVLYWESFDPAAGTGLFATWRSCEGCDDDRVSLEGFTVVGHDGRLATRVCDRDLTCGTDGLSTAALGPGAEEMTVQTEAAEAEVIGFHGGVRETLDLSATLAGGNGEIVIADFAWSEDGERLAVLTYEFLPGESASRIWFVDRRGNARLAYAMLAQGYLGSPPATLDPRDYDAEGYIWGLGGWSPDEQSLLLDVHDTGHLYGADVVALRARPDGARRPATAVTLFHSNRHFDWQGNLAWSPDGRRVAVRTKNHVVEIDAADGRVLAEHPHVDGWLFWPPRDG